MTLFVDNVLVSPSDSAAAARASSCMVRFGLIAMVLPSLILRSYGKGSVVGTTGGQACVRYDVRVEKFECRREVGRTEEILNEKRMSATQPLVEYQIIDGRLHEIRACVRNRRSSRCFFMRAPPRVHGTACLGVLVLGGGICSCSRFGGSRRQAGLK